jgi:hypothetical protein
VEDGRGGGVAGVGGEGDLALDGEGEDGPEGPEVGGRAWRVAADLLGGEEGGGGPFRGQADPGQAGVAVGGEQHGGRAEVEVDQAGGVGGLEGVEERQAELGDPADGEGAVARDQLLQGQAVDQLAGHVDEPVLDDHVVQADQAGMAEGGRRPGLGGHPLPQGRLLGNGRVGAGGEAELLDGQPPAGGHLGSLPGHAALGPPQRGVQHPAASDEARGGVLCHVAANDTAKPGPAQNRR